MTALNRFIYDIYHDKKIVRDGVVPEEFVYRSPGYLAQCEGITPSKEVYSHHFRYRFSGRQGRRVVYIGR